MKVTPINEASKEKIAKVVYEIVDESASPRPYVIRRVRRDTQVLDELKKLSVIRSQSRNADKTKPKKYTVRKKTIKEIIQRTMEVEI